MAIPLALRPGALDAEFGESKPIPSFRRKSPSAFRRPARRRPDVKQASARSPPGSRPACQGSLYPTFSLTATFLTSVENLLNVFSPAGIGSPWQVRSSRPSSIAGPSCQGQLQNALLDQYEIA